MIMNYASIATHIGKLGIVLTVAYVAWVSVAWLLPGKFQEFELIAKVAAVLGALRLAEWLDGHFKTAA